MKRLRLTGEHGLSKMWAFPPPPPPPPQDLQQRVLQLGKEAQRTSEVVSRYAAERAPHLRERAEATVHRLMRCAGDSFPTPHRVAVGVSGAAGRAGRRFLGGVAFVAFCYGAGSALPSALAQYSAERERSRLEHERAKQQDAGWGAVRRMLPESWLSPWLSAPRREEAPASASGFLQSVVSQALSTATQIIYSPPSR